MEPLELLKEDTKRIFKTAREMARNKPMVFSCVNQLILTALPTLPVATAAGFSWINLILISAISHRLKRLFHRAKLAEKEGIDWLFMPSGCKGAELPEYFYDRVRDVKQNSNIKTYGLFGTTGRRSLSLLKEAGMAGFRCGIESPNESILKRVRPSDDLKTRLQTIMDAKDLGLKVWSGFIVGLGESQEDIARGIKMLKDLEVDSVSIGWFNPVPFTEMETDIS